MFSEFMFHEVRLRADVVEDQVWQDILFVNPINILTWPQIALQAIRVLSFPASPIELKGILQYHCLNGDELIKYDVLCLLFNHPLIDLFMIRVVNNSFDSKDLEKSNYEVNKAISGLQKIREDFIKSILSKENKSLDSLQSFGESIRKVFIEIVDSKRVERMYKLYAKELLVWFDSLLERYKIPFKLIDQDESSVEDKEIILTSVRNNLSAMKYTRYWGSYSLSNMDIPQEQILTPLCFRSNDIIEYDAKINSLSSVEKTINLLSNFDPESWTKGDRLIVYSVLVDYCITVRHFSTIVRNRHVKPAARFNDLVEFTGYLSNDVVPILEPAAADLKSAKCIFTKIKMKNCPSHLKFVVVPPEYRTHPALSSKFDPSSNNSFSYVNSSALEDKDEDVSTESQVIALEKAVLRLISVRQIAKHDQINHEVN
jgi:hypothetical protein